MAQNQATGGNSMAATLGNLQNRTQRPGQRPAANYGAGMQAAMRPQGQVWRGPPPTPGGQQPIPPGGAGYPQMSPDAMQNMMGQISQRQKAGAFGPPQQLQSGAPGNMLGGITQGPASLGGALGNFGGGQPQPMGGPSGDLMAQLTGGGMGGPRKPMMPMGAPGMGAGGGKNQQIAQLPGGPPMGR